MSNLTVTEQGQVSLPKELLDHLGIRPGDKAIVNKLPVGRIEMRAQPTGRISDVFGLLRRENGPSLSIDEINQSAAQGWVGATAVIGSDAE